MDNKNEKSPKLRLVKTAAEAQAAPEPKAGSGQAPKSALARQLMDFADDLDKQIERILNS